MNFLQAIQSGFCNYVNFNGRAVRSEFWYWMLFAFIVQYIFDRVAIWLWFSDRSQEPLAELISAVGGLILLLPTIAVGARRLHDIDRTGWWQLLWAVPIVGWIVMIYWGSRRGTSGDNRFGPDPLPPELPASAAPG